MYIFIVVTAFLDEDGYTASEIVGNLEVCVVLDGFIDREITVNLSTVDGTAIGIAGCILLHNICYNGYIYKLLFKYSVL